MLIEDPEVLLEFGKNNWFDYIRADVLQDIIQRGEWQSSLVGGRPRISTKNMAKIARSVTLDYYTERQYVPVDKMELQKDNVSGQLYSMYIQKCTWNNLDGYEGNSINPRYLITFEEGSTPEQIMEVFTQAFNRLLELHPHPERSSLLYKSNVGDILLDVRPLIQDNAAMQFYYDVTLRLDRFYMSIPQADAVVTAGSYEAPRTHGSWGSMRTSRDNAELRGLARNIRDELRTSAPIPEATGRDDQEVYDEDEDEDDDF